MGGRTFLIAAAITVVSLGCDAADQTSDDLNSSTTALTAPGGDTCAPDKTINLPPWPEWWNSGWSTDKAASLKQCSDELFENVQTGMAVCALYCALTGCKWNFTTSTVDCPDSSCTELPPPPEPRIWACFYHGTGKCHCFK
jgi:hypothetical protein